MPNRSSSLPEPLPEAIFESVFETSPASIGIVSLKDGRFLRVNDGFERLFGCERERIQGRTEAEAGFKIDMGEENIEDLRRRLSHGERVRWRAGQVTTMTGERRDVVGSFVPVGGESGDELAVYKLVDITPLRRLERDVLEASDREQRRIGEALHDSLGGRLTQVSFMSQMVKMHLDEGNTEKARHCASKAHEKATQAIGEGRRVIHGLLPLILLEGGLSPALRNLAEQVDGTRGITCRFAGHVSEEVDMSPAIHLYRIAQEAVHNAVKYSEGEQVEIRFRKREGAFVLTVEDGGKGLPPELAGSRLGAADERPQGAGLRSMRYRARLIGARLYLEEGSEGRGLRVRCVLPVDLA